MMPAIWLELASGIWEVLAQQSKPHTWLRAFICLVNSMVLGQAICRLRWLSRTLTFMKRVATPFIDYDKPKEFQNRIDDEMDEDGYVHGRDDAGIGQDLNMDYIEENLIDA